MSNNNEPLVSVITPCFNERQTLPMAMASLMCQTYEQWECIFIDDGSTDGSVDVVEAIEDPRFRIIRFSENQGRGAARQRAHEEVRGKFVAMLDADDWWYTSKLEKQIQYLDEHPEVAIVSTGMVIVDENDDALGFRGCEQINGQSLPPLHEPTIAYAPSCIRADVAANYSYNKKYKVAQDADFIQRICMDQKYSNLPEPLYVYTEYQTYSLEKMMMCMGYRTMALKTFRRQYPLRSRLEIAKKQLKLPVYRLIFALGQDRALISRRSSPATERVQTVYKAQKQAVAQMAEKVF